MQAVTKRIVKTFPGQKNMSLYIYTLYNSGFLKNCFGERNHLYAHPIFRKYKIEYNYGPLTYKITPTYVPEQPLKFKLTKRN
ncbi:hypothetical protein NQ317_006795 [Molorchus minor]|uniref:Uncharacterized protein n=1 Tax=Molorchus minor TaxID=1323400 RepID=A0ABQ9IX65_9CUCU|nr:hypothetical protein NQ317_006795 [Molorchus minor]